MAQTGSPLRPLVFDLDGTLIDSRFDIAAAANHALEATGRASLPVETVCGFVGNGARPLIEGIVGREVSAVEFKELRAAFESYYLEHPIDHNRIKPGAEAALRLPGRAIALCTNKPRPLAWAVTEALGWNSLFQSYFGQVGDGVKKPAPEPLLQVAKELGEDPARIIMIGDGPQDVLAGKAVGAYTVGLRGGLLPVERLIESEPDVVLDSLEQLPEHLEKLGL